MISQIEEILDANSEYAFFVEQTTKLMERRQSVTNTYLYVNTAIVTAVAFMLIDGEKGAWPLKTSIILLLIAGIVACDLWRRLLRRYREMLKWWYARLRELEQDLTESHKLINREYAELYRADSSDKTGLTQYELGLTWLLTGLYLVLIIADLIMLVRS